MWSLHPGLPGAYPPLTLTLLAPGLPPTKRGPLLALGTPPTTPILRGAPALPTLLAQADLMNQHGAPALLTLLDRADLILNQPGATALPTLLDRVDPILNQPGATALPTLLDRVDPILNQPGATALPTLLAQASRLAALAHPKLLAQPTINGIPTAVIALKNAMSGEDRQGDGRNISKKITSTTKNIRINE